MQSRSTDFQHHSPYSRARNQTVMSDTSQRNSSKICQQVRDTVADLVKWATLGLINLATEDIRIARIAGMTNAANRRFGAHARSSLVAVSSPKDL
jgi:hypothetical protein